MVVLHAHHGFVLHRQLGCVFDRREPVGPVQERGRTSEQQAIDLVRFEKERIHRRILQSKLTFL